MKEDSRCKICTYEIEGWSYTCEPLYNNEVCCAGCFGKHVVKARMIAAVRAAKEYRKKGKEE